MKIKDNIYFWLFSVWLIFIIIIIYYVRFYKPNKIIINDIKNNPTKYSNLVRTIDSISKDIPKGALIMSNNIPIEVKRKLSRLKILNEPDYISIDIDSCNKINLEIQKYHWHLEYNGCGNNPNIQFKKQGLFEIWTINKYWTLTKDNDFI